MFQIPLMPNEVAWPLPTTLAHEQDRPPDGVGITLADKRDYSPMVWHMMETVCLRAEKVQIMPLNHITKTGKRFLYALACLFHFGYFFWIQPLLLYFDSL